MARAPDLDALLANADWLGRLSRQLCRDQHAADDAAQEALLASLRSPPRHGTNVRGFLATLLRNVLRVGHREGARRARREQSLPSRDFAEASDLVAARAEVHQVLGRFVLELPEPQRALVLLHWFEGRDVGEIAARSGLTRDAVHGHLRRARETLRGKLQRSDAHRWSAPALLLLERTLWLAPGVTLMTIKTKVAAAAILAAAALCWWTLPAHDPATAAPTETGRAPAAAVVAAGSDARPAEAVTRIDATSDVRERGAPPVATPSSARGHLTGRVVDAAGTPVVPARVYAVASRGGKPSNERVLQDDVDEHGRFDIVPTFDGDVLVVAIPLQSESGAERPSRLHRGLVAASARAAVDREQLVELADIVCPSSVAIDGVVREPGARGVPGVLVGWYPDDTTWAMMLDAFAVSGRSDDRVHVAATRRANGTMFSSGAETDGDGRFTIAAAPGTRGWVFLISARGEGDIERLVTERSVTAPANVTFDLLAPACVRLLADGKPVADARVAFDLGPKDAASNVVYHSDDAGEIRVLRERVAPIRGRALRPGRDPLEFVVPDDATPASPLLVELGVSRTTPLSVVVTSERPLHTLGGMVARRDATPAPITLQPEPGTTVTSLRADVPPGTYRLVLHPGRGAEGDDAFVMLHKQDVAVGDTPVQVSVRVQHGGRIRVTVTTADGSHVPGTIRLVDATGTESKPNMHARDRGNGEGGELWLPGPLTTSQPLLPGRYEVIVDHGAHGTHREFVDVRACETADVAISLQ